MKKSASASASAARNSAAGQRAGGTLAEVLGEIREIIDDQSRAIGGEADDDRGEELPGEHAVAGKERAAEGIAGNGEEIRRAEKLEECAGGRHGRWFFKKRGAG